MANDFFPLCSQLYERSRAREPQLESSNSVDNEMSHIINYIEEVRISA